MLQLRLDRVAMCHAALQAGIRPTGSAIAKAAGIPPQTLNALWSEDREPSLRILLAISGALGGGLGDYLMKATEEVTRSEVVSGGR